MNRIKHAESSALARYEATDLTQDHRNRHAAYESAFAAHVRAGDDGERLRVAAENKIVWNVAAFERILYDGVSGLGVTEKAWEERFDVPEPLGVKHRRTVVELGPYPVAALANICECQQAVENCQ